MKATEFKSTIHQIVEATGNEQVLQLCYDLLKLKKNAKNNLPWKSLSNKQQNEVLLAYEESGQSENLVDARNVFSSLE